ncbi:MAG: thiol-disulfide oxidoreductase [Haliea sp.]|nr:thiol-disulfide oxidoreductase [Haliea sp.]|tara:strand:- start:169552 stop:169914 length:363 start_codon:yes stop_codon:yes gene_type:complete
MPDTLYYDGLCGLCTREIRTLRRLQRGQLDFADIHQLSAGDSLPSREILLKRLHLHTSEGQWLVGLPATVRAWSHTRWGWLFRPLLWPGLRSLSERIYRSWAERRYRRLYACSVCMGAEE